MVNLIFEFITKPNQPKPIIDLINIIGESKPEISNCFKEAINELFSYEIDTNKKQPETHRENS